MEQLVQAPQAVETREDAAKIIEIPQKLLEQVGGGIISFSL
jgi:hypothetical protein